MRTRFVSVGLVVTGLVVSGGCNGIFDIEDAHVNPAPDGGAGGTPGAGGDSQNGGAGGTSSGASGQSVGGAQGGSGAVGGGSGATGGSSGIGGANGGQSGQSAGGANGGAGGDDAGGGGASAGIGGATSGAGGSSAGAGGSSAGAGGSDTSGSGGSAGTMSSTGQSCEVDTDCGEGGLMCGTNVCDWTMGKTCQHAGATAPGTEGWCVLSTDCKCAGMGATCTASRHCTFTVPGGGAGGAAGTTGSSGAAGTTSSGGAGASGTGGAGGGCPLESIDGSATVPGGTILVDVSLCGTAPAGAPHVIAAAHPNNDPSAKPTALNMNAMTMAVSLPGEFSITGLPDGTYAVDVVVDYSPYQTGPMDMSPTDQRSMPALMNVVVSSTAGAKVSIPIQVVN